MVVDSITLIRLEKSARVLNIFYTEISINNEKIEGIIKDIEKTEESIARFIYFLGFLSKGIETLLNFVK